MKTCLEKKKNSIVVSKDRICIFNICKSFHDKALMDKIKIIKILLRLILLKTV